MIFKDSYRCIRSFCLLVLLFLASGMVTFVFFFVFRLRDGSEFLFNTSSHFMMKKWIMKIQESTGKRGYVKPDLHQMILLCH